jgi:hypothetical protein
MMQTNSTLLRIAAVVLVVLVGSSVARADLSTVRYKGSGRSHFYLSTHYPAQVKDREVSFSVYILDRRYVATYTESRRISPGQSEVLATRELTGAISGMRLAGLGTMKQLGGSKNGKPMFGLTLDQAIGAAPGGLVVELGWTAGSSVPPSVR